MEEELVAGRLAATMGVAFDAVWAKAGDLGVDLRRAAGALALERVAEAFKVRGVFP